MLSAFGQNALTCGNTLKSNVTALIRASVIRKLFHEAFNLSLEPIISFILADLQLVDPKPVFFTDFSSQICSTETKTRVLNSLLHSGKVFNQYFIQ